MLILYKIKVRLETTWNCERVQIIQHFSVFFPSFLVLSCAANSTYSPCMSPCPSSCADLAAPSECETTSCMEGCQCAAGFVMSEGICVPYPQCGCTFLNRYYPVSGLWLQNDCVSVWPCDDVDSFLSILQLKEMFVNEDCSQSCECSSTGVVCQPKTCPENYVCTIYNFKRDCYKGM